jgi:hypothetical protein
MTEARDQDSGPDRRNDTPPPAASVAASFSEPLFRRTRLLRTDARHVATPPQPRGGEEYTERGYRAGLFDGSHWLDGDAGAAITETASKVDRLLSYPEHLALRLAAEEATVRDVTLRLGSVWRSFVLVTLFLSWAGSS